MIISRKAAPNCLLLALLAVSSIAFSADSAGTFESFYRSGMSINWVMAGLGALLIGVLVFIGLPVIGPTLAATVSTIGTSVGGLFGLSGIAATNAGLALLGGGAIASGGFGTIGGTALLAAALTFGSEVTIDYAAGALQANFESRQFAKDSLTMVTLPLPKNFSGPDSVKAAGKALDSRLLGDSWTCATRFPRSIDEFKTCLAEIQAPQRQLVQYALAAMDVNKASTLGPAAQERESAMYAVLHFLNNNYPAANKAAFQSYTIGIAANDTPTVPAFIASASMLYDDNPNLGDSLAMFQYAVTAEPKNPLTPVMFAAYLDRLAYRLNDGAAGIDQIDRLSRLAQGLADDERKLVIQQELLSRCVMQIKLAQQRVVSVTSTQNSVVLENPRVLNVMRSSLRDYGQLVNAGNALVARQNELLPILANNTSLWDKWTGTTNPFTDTTSGWPASMQQFSNALANYNNGRKDMENRISRFEKEIADASVAKKPDIPDEQRSWPLFDWVRRLFK